MEENNFNNDEIQQTVNTEENTSNSGEQKYNVVNQPPHKSSDGTSTASLVLGIVSLSLSIFCCGGGIASVVCGIIGLVLGIPQMKKNPDDTKAKTGVILSAIGLALYICLIGVSIVFSITGLLSEIMYGINWI